MEKTTNQLPNWISNYASLGSNIELEGERTDDNYFWYLLSLCSPPIFEKYAIVLHPFWINWKAKELIESGLQLTEEQLENRDFERLSWSDFFKLYSKEFDLSTAFGTNREINETIREDWPLHVWFPGEGDCEIEELQLILSTAGELISPNERIYCYYTILKTFDWKEDLIFSCELKDFKLPEHLSNLNGSPTAVFPENPNWCIISDYDMPFTYVGGSAELINRITSNNEFEIFEIERRFKEKTPANRR